MRIDNVFEIGDIVYLKTDEDQKPRMILSIEVFAQGELLYRLISGTFESHHYDYEMSKEKTYFK
jgi:uncharacterized protein YodC (DUF2158 family)